MAVNRPLRIASNELRIMSDNELSDLCTELRKAYAYRLYYSDYVKYDLNRSAGATASSHMNPINTGNPYFEHICPGAIFSGRGHAPLVSTHDMHTVGDMNTTFRDVAVNTRANDNTGGSGTDAPGTTAGSDYPSYPTSTPIVTAYNWKWRQYTPTTSQGYLKPDNNMKRTFSYLVNKGGNSIGPETSDTNIIDTVFKEMNYQMLFGDRIGSYDIRTSAPASGWVKANRGNSGAYAYQDVQGTGVYYNQVGNFSTRSGYTYYWWINMGSGADYVFNNSLPSQTNVPLQWRPYTATMQTGTAIRQTGPNQQIDDYFLEGTYKGTLYVKANDTNGTPRYSTNNSSYTTVALNTTQHFDTFLSFNGSNSNAHGKKIASNIFYPTGNSNDGYCRIWLNAPPNKTYRKITTSQNSNFGAGLGPEGGYNTSNVYKFTYEPAVQACYFPSLPLVNAADYTTHDQTTQSQLRRLSLIYNVLLPLYEARGSGENQNYLRYTLYTNTDLSTTSTRRQLSTIYDVHDYWWSNTESLVNNTYYRTRYRYVGPFWGTTTYNRRYLYAESLIGTR